MNDVGKEVRHARKSRGLSLTAFAKTASMDASALSKIENNRVWVRVDTLDHLAHALNMELEVRLVEKTQRR